MGIPTYVAISHMVWECSSKSDSQYQYLDNKNASSHKAMKHFLGRLQTVIHAHFDHTITSSKSKRNTCMLESLRFNDVIVFWVNKILPGWDAETWYYSNLFFSELQSSSFAVITVGYDKKQVARTIYWSSLGGTHFFCGFGTCLSTNKNNTFYKEKSTAGWYSTPNILLICLLFSREIGPPGCIFAHH